ncbi:MAG: CPBP family intramembrane glutamic endopeptidase [Halobellus sp.]
MSPAPSTSERSPASEELVPRTVDTSRLAAFFGVLLVLAVGFVAAARVSNVRLVALAPAYMFTPLVAAAITMWRSDVSVGEVGVRIGRLRWYPAAAVVPLALVAVALGLSIAAPGVTFDPTADPTPGIGLPSGLVGIVALAGLVLGLGMTVNAAFALGEEAGWRGYLLWELAPLGFWRASALIGVVWGLWHAPVILDGYNYPSFPLVGVGAMTVATVAFSPLYTYVCLRARSVLAAAVFHGVFNASAGIVTAYAATESALLDELVASPVGLAGIAAFGLATAALAIVGTPELSRAALGSERADSDGPSRG